MRKLNPLSKRETRYQAITRKRELLKTRLQGEGLYVYRNNTSGTLSLPKPAFQSATRTNLTEVPLKGEFEGDNYFMMLVHRNEAILVKTIRTPEQERNPIVEEKLILDQPDTVKTVGKVEHVVATEPVKKLDETETKTVKEVKDVLLTEDPLNGVKIIMNS